MNHRALHRKEESKDRLKSGIITAAIWSALLMFLFVYKVAVELPKKKEVETKMLINFGDSSGGSGAEEPANQEGSLPSENNPAPQQPSNKVVEKALADEDIITAEEPSEKIITGNDTKRTAKTTVAEKSSTASGSKTVGEKKSSEKKSLHTPQAAHSKTGSGDSRGEAAIGNLIKGRGTKAGSQGSGSGNGNSGDPLGGNSGGDSKIGIDRKLISYIPGTMGRGGAKPSHSCEASGSITVSYTVDKAGNVISARRSGGISDPCVVSTSVSWVKKYVKAEKAATNSMGSYKITF